MALELHEGDFWDFRWEQTDQSCAQGSGCRTGTEKGVFRVTLGTARTIAGVPMFAVEQSGLHLADDGGSDLGVKWAYLGSDGGRLLGSNGSSLVTLFDAQAGQWIGGGMFSRFGNTETHAASNSSISATADYADWAGVETGPAIVVVR